MRKPDARDGVKVDPTHSIVSAQQHQVDTPSDAERLCNRSLEVTRSE